MEGGNLLNFNFPEGDRLDLIVCGFASIEITLKGLALTL